VKEESPDSIEELQRAYRRSLASRPPSDRASCPDPAALETLALGRGPEAARLKLLDHVMQCPDCRREFDLLRTLAEAEPHRGMTGRTWMAAAASVVILFGAGYGVWRGVGGGGEAVLRGPSEAVVLVTPAPDAAPPGSITFLWRSQDEAFEYVLEILDPEGESLFTHRTSDTVLLLDPAGEPTLRGDLLWWVRARLRNGEERASELRGFRLPGH